jgi:hypothetical protein
MKSNQARDVIRIEAMTALDFGLLAVAMYTIIVLLVPVIVSGAFVRTAVQSQVGWYGTMVAMSEASAVRAFIGYLVTCHLAILGVYWLVWRARSYHQVFSDGAAFVLAAMVTVCSVPTFLAGWEMLGFHAELLSPGWLPRFSVALGTSVGGASEAEGSPVLAAVLLNLHSFLLPAIVYVSSFWASGRAYKFNKVK